MNGTPRALLNTTNGFCRPAVPGDAAPAFLLRGRVGDDRAYGRHVFLPWSAFQSVGLRFTGPLTELPVTPTSLEPDCSNFRKGNGQHSGVQARGRRGGDRRAVRGACGQPGALDLGARRPDEK
jgi:hypothetical protein